MCCVICSCLIVTRDHVIVSQVRYLGGDHWPDPYQAGSQIQWRGHGLFLPILSYIDLFHTFQTTALTLFIIIHCQVVFYSVVKLRSRSRSGEGKVRVRRVRFGPELYPIFGFHPPSTLHPPHKLFLGFKGPQTCHIDLGRVSMTQVWSEVVSISRWTTRWT